MSGGWLIWHGLREDNHGHWELPFVPLTLAGRFSRKQFRHKKAGLTKQEICFVLFETGSHSVAQAGFKLCCDASVSTNHMLGL